MARSVPGLTQPTVVTNTSPKVKISVAMAGKAEAKLRPPSPLPHVTILPAHGFLPTADRAGSGERWDEEELETAIK
jgi:hypothetical protein